MKKGAILLVTLLSLLLVVGCGSSTDQTAIIPSIASSSYPITVPAGVTATSSVALISGTSPLVGPKTETWVMTQGTSITLTSSGPGATGTKLSQTFTAISAGGTIVIAANGDITVNQSSNNATTVTPTAVSAASVKVPANSTVSFASATANANIPPTLSSTGKVELTPGAVYTVTVTEGGQTYSYTFTQPATAGGQSAISPAAVGFTFFNIASDGTATKKTFAPVAGGTVDTATATPTATKTKTKKEVEEEVGDVTVPSFSATFSHESDVDGDGEYSKGDKFKVTVTLDPGEEECKINVKVVADGGLYVSGERMYFASAGAVTSAIITTTDMVAGISYNSSAMGDYEQNYHNYDAQDNMTTFAIVNEDGTFPYNGTYTYEVTVTDKAGNMTKATGSVLVNP